MSQETKGRTMIGTGAPANPPRPGSGHPHPPPASPAPIPTPPAPDMAPTISPPVMAPTIPGPAMPPPDEVPLMAPTVPGFANAPSGAAPPSTASAPTVSGHAPDTFIGQELCGYLIQRKLAEGGTGVVYEAVHGKIGRRAAIKVLRPEFCRSEAVVERFYQEARAVNAIRHENIVDIYDFGRDPYGRVFFVMECLEGEPLSARIRRGALSWSEAFPILEQTLRALKAAHDTGFVHRDLKPDNIWLAYIDGWVQVKLLDFGIAKLVGTDSPAERLTRTGTVIGTPHYMSPEQINGAPDIDHRTDIYALGVILYEMFAGVTPFLGETLQAIMTGHLFHEPPRLSDIPVNLGVPAPIVEIVDRMLVKHPAGRYDSATDVLADLYDVNANRWPAHAEALRHARPKPPTAPIARSIGAPRRSGKRAFAIGGLLSVAAIAGVVIWQSPDVPAPAVTSTPVPETVTKPPPPPPPLDDDALLQDARTTLRASLRETEPAVRVQGTDALGKIKDQPSAPALTELTEKDLDSEVRGHTAEALGEIGAPATAPLLAKLESAAPPPLKVWYASALARLGDKGAAKRLLAYAHSPDLAVSFKAGITLADISPPGDDKAIQALRALASHEADLNSVAPYAGAVILSKLTALRDPSARRTLYAILEHADEGARLAAAEGLARLGDDAGRKILADVLANQASPNRLVAAVAQIPLGEYGGLDLITQKLGDKNPQIRRLAARGLGEISERTSLPRLVALEHDKDWTVRIAAAAAIVAIAGLDPQVLAQASVDWTRSALASQDLAVRQAAAGVLADVPTQQALPLLAQAIADPAPAVRLAAARSAGKIKRADAATKIAFAAKAETDPEIKEQQIKSLGEIGQIGGAAAHDALLQLSREPGRLGVIASGALIAIGDASGKAKLDAAIAAPQIELRLAAMQAAAAAKNAIVMPTLKLGVADRRFEIRFAAAEGLAAFPAEKAAAAPVLTEALASKDASVVGRAMAGLARLGAKIADLARNPAEMLDSTDPRLRLAVVTLVRALAPGEGIPLLRRLVADPDQDVRHDGIDAIADLAAHNKAEAIKLYKPLVGDADPVVRSKASGQLARLFSPSPSPPPGPDDTLTRVQQAFNEATAAAAEAKKTTEAFETAATELAATIAKHTHDDATLAHVAALKKSLEDAPAKLAAAAKKLKAAVANVEATAKDGGGAGPSPEVAKIVADAKALVHTAHTAATAARDKAASAVTNAAEFLKDETSDVQILVASAAAATVAGDFPTAKANLDRAAKRLRDAGASTTSLDYSYAQLYDKMSEHTRDPATKRKLLLQAQAAYQRFARAGAGPPVQRAKDRLTEIADELKELGSP